MPGPPLAKLGAPHWPPYRPSDAPPGPMATASLTGLLLATYWPSGRPPTGHRLATKGRPSAGGLRTAPLWPPTGHKGTGGDAFARPLTYGRPPAPSPDWPPKGPKTDLATYAPHTGRLWPSDGRPPPPPHRLTDWPPTPTHWPPQHSPTPQTFGERWPKGRGGFFACKGGRYDVGRVPYTPFGDPPYPYPHRLTRLAPNLPPRLAT